MTSAKGLHQANPHNLRLLQLGEGPLEDSSAPSSEAL